MSSAVVYESSFGNTRRVAEQVAETIGATYLLSVDETPPDLSGLDLLVIGGPTHVHGMSRESTRKAAIDQGATALAGIGVRGWLDRMPRVDGLRAAAFDTRADKPALVTGSAARGIAKALKRHGCTVVSSASFLVTGTAGDLADGEAERAAGWARELA
ncbi:MAG TPA: hypothetical protein VI408_12395 [Gaiellaceae bacterium]